MSDQVSEDEAHWPEYVQVDLPQRYQEGRKSHFIKQRLRRHQLAIAAQAVSMGGNLRVGLEDSLWLGAGKLATSNADQVTAARQIVEAMGLEIATPDEAREMLQLKGANKVNF